MAGRLDVVTYGENDKYLTLNPEGTLFHKQFTKHPNFSINYTDLNPKRENIGFGKTVKFTIPQNVGDLLKCVTLTIKADDIPNEWNLYYQDGAGIAVIEYADLIIGGTVVERLDSNYITINKAYFNNSRQQEGIENLTGLIPQSTFSSWYGCRKSFSTKHTQKKFDFQVDLPFHFYKSTELSLPLCAITKQEVEVEIKFRDLKDILFSKIPDLYGEDCVNFPIPTFYDGNWVRRGPPIFLELIKGWERTVYSYFKYSGVSWYENPGASMSDARLGENSLSIYRGNGTTKTRSWYPYSDTYSLPAWSMRDFLVGGSGGTPANASYTYDLFTEFNVERYIDTDITKVFYNSFPNKNNGTISMRIIDGTKEYSKNATLVNPYLSTNTLEILDTIYYDTTTYNSFSMEKTGPNMLNDVFNYQIENVYGGSDNPFTDIGTQNDLAEPFNWKNRGLIAATNNLGESWGVRFTYGFGSSSPPFVTAMVNAPGLSSNGDFDYSLYPTVGHIRIFAHHPVSDEYDISHGTSHSNMSADRLKKIEELESGEKLSSEVVTSPMLELHAFMHNYVQRSVFKDIDIINEPGLFLGLYSLPRAANQVNSSYHNFGKITRMSSAGKAIVASMGSIGSAGLFSSLRIYTWYPNKLNGTSNYPGYTDFGQYFTRTDFTLGGTYHLVWPNSSISVDTTSSTVNSLSDFQLSDYWETSDFGPTFLDGRTAEQDNGSFALFWGHVRNITIPRSFVPDTTSNATRGSVSIYQWNFNDWDTYDLYRQDWEKPFSLVQTLEPPDSPTYNFNFGQAICISRTSQMLIVSEPHWVPSNRLGLSKVDNQDWNVGRVQVYKRVPTTTVTNLIVTVAQDPSSGSNKFYINGVQQDTIELHANKTYTFNQSDTSNNGHPLKFSETSNGVHNGGTVYTTGVTSNGNLPGGGDSSPALTTFVVPIGKAGTTLYYYCQNHSGMGGSMNITTAGGSYRLHQTIYPELPSYTDRLKHSIDFGHAIYTSWNDPIQKRWEFGKTMDFSDDDKTLIIGADSNTDLGRNESPTGTVGGWVSIYELDGSGNFKFKSIVNQILGDGVDSGFASKNISVSGDGNDLAVSANTADWNPKSELPFPDTTYDPLAETLLSETAIECGNIQLFSRDTKTPKNYNDVNIEMDTCKLRLELVHLDKIERDRIKNNPITRIITQLQLNTFNWQEYEGRFYDDEYVQKSQKIEFKLSFCNPVKELFIVTKKNNKRAIELLQDPNTTTSELCFFQGITDFDGFVRNYGNRETNNVFVSTKYPQAVMESIKSVSLKLDDEELIPFDGVGEFASHFLRAIPGSKYHTNTALNRRIYMWSFANRPELSKPSGQLNFSSIKNQLLKIEGFKTGWTHRHDLFVYAKSYNVIKIRDGNVQLLYPLHTNGKSMKLRDVDDFPNPNVDSFLIGNETVIHERAQNYIDPGLNVSSEFTFESSNNLDINTVGNYSFNYSIVNEHGKNNHKAFTRFVNVVDTTAPVVSLNFPNSNPVNLIFNDTVSPVYFQPYLEYGAAADTGETIVTTFTRTPIGGGTTVPVAAVNPTIEGVYTVIYTATDGSGNIGTNTRIVNVTKDTLAPLLSLTNPNQNPINLIYNDTVTPVYSQSYIEYGATSDGGETVVIDSSAVNTTTAGTYIVTYTATDTAGNIGTTTRSVIVTLDTTSPLVTLNTPNYNNVNLIYNNLTGYSQSYTEYGATSDGGETIVTTITRSPIGGGATVSVNSVNVTFEGIYTVTYTATDISGNTGTNIRTITVTQDIIAPTITLTNPSENPVRLTYNSTVTPVYSEPYVEYGATADGGETVVIDSSAVNVTSEGTYTVTYTATDIAGNIGTASRTVIVTEDDIDPILTLTNPSANPIYLIFNDSISPTYIQPYVEYGATSNGGETVSIDTSAIQSTTQGTYNVVYSATDIAGNTGTVIRQVVYTRDTSAPIISLNNPSYNPVDLVYNSTNGYSETYTEHGATSDGGETVTQVVRRNGTVVSAVNPTQAGTYIVTYSATDSAGNIGTNTRTIVVTNDTVAPVLNLQGSSYIKVVQNYGGSLGIPNPPITINAPDQSLSYSTNSTVNMSTPGTYTITYSVTDRALNVGTVSRTVQVYSTSGATASFSLNGGNATVTECDTYGQAQDAGVTSVVADTTNTPQFSSGNINTSATGTYTVSWTATSKILGGNSLTRNRTVTVNAISFSPSTTTQKYSGYEPIVDTNNFSSLNLAVSDSINTNYNYPPTITRITRSYSPTCNTRTISGPAINRILHNVRYSVAANQISTGSQYTFVCGTTGGLNTGTIVQNFTYTHPVASSNYTAGDICRVGNNSSYLRVAAESSGRIRINWVGPSLGRTAYINLNGASFPSASQKLMISVTGKMTRSGVITSVARTGFSSWRAYWRVTHSYTFTCRLYKYGGSGTPSETDMRTGNNFTSVGGTGFSKYRVESGSRTGGSAQSAQDAAQVQINNRNYRLFPTTNTNGQNIYFKQFSNGINSSPWNARASGTTDRSSVFQDPYINDFAT